ncbi:MAG TPA: aminotransferase class V-fold PLP-dependent enzyme [Candidatus Baltobacteraceae bacterium]|nr:aminotransferase class V-fold PLP-dependent enzyme [Candidatus Baltobacteraceae bacterium]
MTTPLPRDFFAVTETFRYLNHAAVGVLARPTREALRAFIDAHATGGVMGVYTYEGRMPEYRDRVARFIGARPGTVAILRNTGDGANAVAGGLQWQPGDEIIMPDNEFPANAQPWLALRKHGVNIRLIETARERLTPDVLRHHITGRTKLVTVSWVSFEDGYRHDLVGLAEIAHERGALFAVDAIQGLGAFPLDVQTCGVDALYCGGAKWMLALQGVSFLYVCPELNERLAVAAPGWRSSANMWDFLDYEQPFSSDATRFEGGTPNFIGALSLAESIGVIESAGTRTIAEHVLALTDRLAEGLCAQGAELATIRGAAQSSGIVTFRLPGSDPIALGKALQREGIVTTYRSNGVRVSPHGYNTFDDVEALIAGVKRYRKEVACSP